MCSFALIGKSGSGKTSAARIFESRFGVLTVSTGTICRKISSLLFGNDDKAATQRLDDALTAMDASIFVKAALRNVPPERLICLDALRFSSDLVVACERGLITIRITAPENIRNLRLAERKQGFNPAIDGIHRSETELNDVPVDYTIVNDGTPEELENAIEKIYKNHI
jgi:dephospho-CoA kinase